MFLKRLQEEGEEEEQQEEEEEAELFLAGKKNAMVLSNRPWPSLRNDLPSKTTSLTWHK